MKEKENATCRCCGQKLPIKAQRFFFHEEWKESLSNFSHKTIGYEKDCI